MQLKYSNYVAFSHFHGKAVNNSGLNLAVDVITQKRVKQEMEINVLENRQVI